MLATQAAKFPGADGMDLRFLKVIIDNQRGLTKTPAEFQGGWTKMDHSAKNLQHTTQENGNTACSSLTSVSQCHTEHCKIQTLLE